MLTDKQSIQPEALSAYIDADWDNNIVPLLTDYIRIPCLSIDFDADWQQSGYMQEVKAMALQWLQQHKPDNAVIYSEDIEGLTPLIIVDIPGDSEQTILMYGHLDKQPEMEGWWPGFGPWDPVYQEGKLYGRGGADDGYALFAAVSAIKALQQQAAPHARIVILIEFSEESGSPHLVPYLEKYQELIGSPDLVIALDSGAGDYERMWSTTSLRGMLSCTVTAKVLQEATHSGIASGIVPCSMRIMRQLLERIEDAASGEVLIRELHADIPPYRLEQAKLAAEVLGDDMLSSFSKVETLIPVDGDTRQLILNNTWRPTVCVVGQNGIPAVKDAGNVMRAYTSFKLSFRLPPSVKYETVKPAIIKMLTEDPPYGCELNVEFDQGGDGWDSPQLAPWLEQASAEASQQFYQQPAAYIGLGASIPFMSMLGEQFPRAQFLITGVLGPKSNAHGPNEFIHIPYAKKLTACVSYIIARHFQLCEAD